MASCLLFPFLWHVPSPFIHSFKLSIPTNSSHFLSSSSSSHSSIGHHLISNYGKRDSESLEKSISGCLNEELLRRVSGAKCADEAMDMIVEARGGVAGGEVSNENCRSIIAVAIDRGNVELALSVFHAMHSGYGQALSEKISSIERWSWAQPDAHTCALLVQGLAASLRVSDAIKIISYISGVSVPSGEEVRFGMIVPCPICMVAIAVAQPQLGIQVASCSKCRYQYQLVSGDIVSIDSEVIRICYCRTQHG